MVQCVSWLWCSIFWNWGEILLSCLLVGTFPFHGKQNSQEQACESCSICFLLQVKMLKSLCWERDWKIWKWVCLLATDDTRVSNGHWVVQVSSLLMLSFLETLTFRLHFFLPWPEKTPRYSWHLIAQTPSVLESIGDVCLSSQVLCTFNMFSVHNPELVPPESSKHSMTWVHKATWHFDNNARTSFCSLSAWELPCLYL